VDEPFLHIYLEELPRQSQCLAHGPIAGGGQPLNLDGLLAPSTQLDQRRGHLDSWLILSAHGLPPGIEIVDRVADGVVHLSFLLEGKARAHVLVAYKLSFQGFVMLSLEDKHACSS
jgi:hypothetical protein